MISFSETSENIAVSPTGIAKMDSVVYIFVTDTKGLHLTTLPSKLPNSKE